MKRNTTGLILATALLAFLVSAIQPAGAVINYGGLLRVRAPVLPVDVDLQVQGQGVGVDLSLAGPLEYRKDNRPFSLH